MGMSTNGWLTSPISGNLQRKRKGVRWPASSHPKQRKWRLPRNSYSSPYSQGMFNINSKKIDLRGELLSSSPAEAQKAKVKSDIIIFLKLMDSHGRWYYLSHLCMIKLSPCTCELINEKKSERRYLFLSWTTLKSLSDIYYSQLFDFINTSKKQSSAFIISYDLPQTHLIFSLSHLPTTNN